MISTKLNKETHMNKMKNFASGWKKSGKKGEFFSFTLNEEGVKELFTLLKNKKKINLLGFLKIKENEKQPDIELAVSENTYEAKPKGAVYIKKTSPEPTPAPKKDAWDDLFD